MKKTNEKEFNLKESFVLWKSTSKEGKAYFTGKADGKKVVGFYNTNKKNPKEPDLRVIDGDDKSFASLWCNVSKDEKKYLAGSLEDGARIVGFFAKEEDEKKPFIRVYLSDSERPAKETTKTSKKETKVEETEDDKLPF